MSEPLEKHVHVTVLKYYVGVRRGTDLKHWEQSARREDFRRYLSLEVEGVDATAFRDVHLYFFEEPPAELGRQSPADGSVDVALPASDFDAIYRVVQAEHPIHLHWEADDRDRLVWFQIGTEAEPPGEGPSDRSS